jgi:hypothetical protein
MYYNTRNTNKHIADVLPKVLDQIAKVHGQRPDLILLAWPQIIGDKFAPMTKAISFKEGVLTVHVNNSTLYSILAQQEKKRLLRQLKEKFPSVQIRDLLFRLG